MRVGQDVSNLENESHPPLGPVFSSALGLATRRAETTKGGGDTASFLPGDEDYENTLNSLAVDMADGIDIDNRKVSALKGDAADKFEALVIAELNAQRADGKTADLSKAIDNARKALFERIGHALDNSDRNADKGLDVFEGYWKRHGGKDDAISAGYAGYDNFLADNTVTDNPSYEDNLNALASSMAGATLTDSRNILHIDSSETLSQLYQNLIDSKAKDGFSPSDAVTQVNDDLRARIGSAAGDDGNKVTNVFDGYWSRHGGETNTRRLADNAELDTARRDHDLPAFSDVDIQSMETSEIDPDDSSRKLTVSELTWQNLIEDWKTGIEDGSIDKNDERAQFYRALRAQGALENGLDLVGLDISEGLSLDHASGDDLSSVVDGEKLDARLGDLFASEAVQKDYASAQTGAVSKVANKDNIASQLEETAFSEAYIDYINDLRESGQGELAEQDISKTYNALSTLFPATEETDKVAEFAQNLQVDSMVTDLDDLIANPDQINDANTATATQDVVKTVLTALKRAGVDIPRRTAETIDKFVNEYLNDQQTAKNFGKALQELGDRFQKNGSITQKDIDSLMKNGVYKALNEKTNGGMMSLIGTLNGNGALGSAGGLISLASGIYQLAGKGGSLADTTEGRMAIAKEFISFFGASQHFVNLGSNIIDKVNGTNVNAMLGLDKTLPQIWGDDKVKGKAPAPDPHTWERFSDNMQQIIKDAPVGDQEALAKKLDISYDDAGKVVKGAKDGFAKNPALPDATTTTRSVSSFLRVLDGAANSATGALDIALGGLMIKRGADSGDGATIGQGAVTVAAGAFGLAGGASSLAALKGIAVARAATGPLFWVSAALTLATLPFSIVQDIKRTNALEGHEADLKDLFTSLDEDGLLTEDGLNRYEFLEEYMQNYGQRDAPDDQSIFEYRSDEYAFYTEEGHLPESGWDDFNHEDYAGDGSNLETQMA
jgi:DNA-binding phage protein